MRVALQISQEMNSGLQQSLNRKEGVTAHFSTIYCVRPCPPSTQKREGKRCWGRDSIQEETSETDLFWSRKVTHTVQRQIWLQTPNQECLFQHTIPILFWMILGQDVNSGVGRPGEGLEWISFKCFSMKIFFLLLKVHTREYYALTIPSHTTPGSLFSTSTLWFSEYLCFFSQAINTDIILCVHIKPRNHEYQNIQ